jgi:hypothetical protein
MNPTPSGKSEGIYYKPPPELRQAQLDKAMKAVILKCKKWQI